MELTLSKDELFHAKRRHWMTSLLEELSLYLTREGFNKEDKDDPTYCHIWHKGPILLGLSDIRGCAPRNKLDYETTYNCAQPNGWQITIHIGEEILEWHTFTYDNGRGPACTVKRMIKWIQQYTKDQVKEMLH